MTLSQITALFGIIMTTCSPSSPTELWEKYKFANGRGYIPPNTAREVRYDLGLYNRNL